MDATTQSFLPADATWAGALLLAIAGLVFAALVIGLVARLVMPERYAEQEGAVHGGGRSTGAADSTSDSMSG